MWKEKAATRRGTKISQGEVLCATTLLNLQIHINT